VKRRAAPVAASGASETPTGGELKIIKLECALSNNGSEATATNMATLISINNAAQTNKKYSGGGTRHNVTKGPSDVLINCFKINDLEIDERKVDM
jgi:hypothetical protein